VKEVDGAACVFSSGKEDSAITARTVVGAEGDVGAKDSACATKEVLEILPTNTIGELGWTFRGMSGDEQKGLTLPTNSCVRVSLWGLGDGWEEVASWMTASMSSLVRVRGGEAVAWGGGSMRIGA